MIKQFAVAIFLALELTAYATAVSAEEKTTLTVVNAGQGRMAAAHFKNAEDCSGGKIPFKPGNVFASGQSVTIDIDPTHDFSMYVTTLDRFAGTGLGIGFSSCLVPFTFTPTAGKAYTVVFSANQKETACGVKLTATDSSGTQIEEPSFRPRDWRSPFLESGAFCKRNAP